MRLRVKTLFLSFFLPALLLGQSLEDDRAQELDSLRRNISFLEQQLKESEAKKRSVEEELRSVQLRRELLEQELRSLELQTQLKEDQLQDLQVSLESVQSDLQEEKTLLLSKLRFLQHMGSLGYLRLIFMSETGADMLDAFRWILHLAQQDKNLIERYRTNLAEIQKKKELEGQLHSALQEFQRDRQAKRNQLNAAIREHRYLLAKIQKEEKQTLEQVAQLEEKAQRLERLLTILSSTDTTRQAKEDIHGYRGVLDWPIRGKVVVPFGTQTNPDYGTKVDMKGIQIEVAKSQDVSPIFPGRVTYASWFKGYRNLVLVDHGFGVISIYGYLDSLAAKKDDWVYPGKILGKVIAGGTTDPKLYLEIRDTGRSVDPASWLR